MPGALRCRCARSKPEWLWAGRGLALVLSTDGSNVVALVVVAQTTLEDYRG